MGSSEECRRGACVGSWVPCKGVRGNCSCSAGAREGGEGGRGRRTRTGGASDRDAACGLARACHRNARAPRERKTKHGPRPRLASPSPSEELLDRARSAFYLLSRCGDLRTRVRARRVSKRALAPDVNLVALLPLSLFCSSTGRVSFGPGGISSAISRDADPSAGSPSSLLSVHASAACLSVASPPRRPYTHARVQVASGLGGQDCGTERCIARCAARSTPSRSRRGGCRERAQTRWPRVMNVGDDTGVRACRQRERQPDQPEREREGAASSADNAKRVLLVPAPRVRVLPPRVLLRRTTHVPSPEHPE